MERKEIFKKLKHNRNGMRLEQLAKLLRLDKPAEVEALVAEINQMKKEGLLYHIKSNDSYAIFDRSRIKEGILSVVSNEKGYGFVAVEGLEKDVKIDACNLNGARHKDKVRIELYNRNEGRVIQVLNRGKEKFAGEYYLENGIGYVKLDDKHFKNIKVQVADSNTLVGCVGLDDKHFKNVSVEIENPTNLVAGEKVEVMITDDTDLTKCKGKILSVIGNKSDPGVDISSIAVDFGINLKFSEEVMNEVKDIPSFVTEKDLVDRRDLRGEVIFTIDGDDAKDFDDAVSIEKLDNGNYLLGVHIADVSYYIKENSELDKEAYDRATSVYLTDRVIPMLPHELSDNICSLIQGSDRLTMSCDMEIDHDGNIIKHDIYQSVINSKKRMTYNNVNKLLEHNEIVEDYAAFEKPLRQMVDLAKILRANKTRRGYLDFDIDEAKVTVDENGKPTDVTVRPRNAGEKLIEDFMIAANETVATHLSEMFLPSIYRIHEKPDYKKIRQFINFVSSMGYTLKKVDRNIDSKTIQDMLESLKTKEEFSILSSLLLRSMKKAKYSPDNVGHFGIGSKTYTHFTSPIRRYPDTTIHRLIRTYLLENKQDQNTINYWKEKLYPLCDHSSLKEVNAAECEREVDKMKMAEYMTGHIGERYEGIVSGVTNYGIYVVLDNCIEGLVRLNESDKSQDPPVPKYGEFFSLNEETMTLVGGKTNTWYRLGDKVLIEVEDASKEERRIDFKVIEKCKKLTK